MKSKHSSSNKIIQLLEVISEQVKPPLDECMQQINVVLDGCSKLL
jgi:hypothetical protein